MKKLFIILMILAMAIVMTGFTKYDVIEIIKQSAPSDTKIIVVSGEYTLPTMQEFQDLCYDFANEPCNAKLDNDECDPRHKYWWYAHQTEDGFCGALAKEFSKYIGERCPNMPIGIYVKSGFSGNATHLIIAIVTSDYGLQGYDPMTNRIVQGYPAEVYIGCNWDTASGKSYFEKVGNGNLWDWMTSRK